MRRIGAGRTEGDVLYDTDKGRICSLLVDVNVLLLSVGVDEAETCLLAVSSLTMLTKRLSTASLRAGWPPLRRYRINAE